MTHNMEYDTNIMEYDTIYHLKYHNMKYDTNVTYRIAAHTLCNILRNVKKKKKSILKKKSALKKKKKVILVVTDNRSPLLMFLPIFVTL